MKFRHLTYLFVATWLILAGCSTKNNTAATRSYHRTTARYNINFNAKTNFDKGIDQMQKSVTDDYSQLLPLYPISIHENGTAVASTMDIVIEKCRKTIKNHSITKKPKKNPKKSKDADYQLWYKQVEFNREVVRAWILLGMAEFHKADFIGSVGTFTYITKHYATQPEVVAEARIWLARAYAEMQWFYEAEEVLGKINENDLPRELNGLFAAAKADLLIKTNHHAEAIPFLEVAIDKEKNRYQRMRFHYVLGQLLIEKGDRKSANSHFKEVVKRAPNYTVEFNARMQMLTSETENLPKAVKSLEKMAKNPNNKDYLDQIYYAIGNIYFFQNADEAAISSYKKAIELSTRGGIEKAVVLLKLGGIYYDRRQYIDAHPCYEEAATIVNAQHADYQEITKRAETLGELAMNYNTVQLQDSLQALSHLSPAEQRAVVEKIIAKILEEEEAERQREADAQAMAMAANDDDSFNRPGMTNGSGEWYFYNQQLINAGRQQFNKRWGQRRLEDNWRRMNKSAQPAETATDTDDDDDENDSTKNAVPDNKNPQFYLSQIPQTDEQIELSNAQIANALIAMAGIYEKKLADLEMAETTLAEYERRFPNGEQLLECYYAQYQLFGALKKVEKRAAVRQKIIEKFPDSKQAIILSQPDYADRVAQMYALQDSLYAAAYDDYSHNRFAEVQAKFGYMQTNYPLSSLMPKFTFLNALSLGKTASQEQFHAALDTLVQRYPQSDVATMSKDILALMSQGKEAKQGSVSSIADIRQQELQAEIDEPITEKTFTAERKMPFAILLQPTDNQEINQFLYDIAAYNFSKFLLKDYDLTIRTIEGTKFVLLSGFENFDETVWYRNLAKNEAAFAEILARCSEILPISDENLSQITLLGLENYRKFCRENF